MEPIRTIASSYVLLPIDNIDTDVIIPARFLKVTGKASLRRHLFANWRYTMVAVGRAAGGVSVRVRTTWDRIRREWAR